MRTPIAITSAALLLALTACGEADNEDTAAQDRIDDLETQVAELEDQLASSEADAETEPAQDDAEEDDADQEDENDDSVWEDSDDGEAEPTGGESAEVGEAAPIDGWMTGEPLGTLTLEQIERNFTNPECQEWGDTPESGEFVALHFTLEAASDAADQVTIFEDDFYLVDDDSNMLRNEIHTASAWSCAIDSGSLESAPPGTTTSGVVLLDTTLEAGTLVYDGGDTDVRWDF